MSKIYQVSRVRESCLELTRARLRYCFDHFDRVAVSFSGGKDSTCCLNLSLEVARERGRLPLDVYTFDEEAIPPETVEYMARVALNPDVRFLWYCVPIQHRNACSKREAHWYPWAPEDRHKWVRDLPAGAITELAGFTRGMAIPDAVPLIYGPGCGTVCHVLGIRTQESITRHRSICQKYGPLAFMFTFDGANVWCRKAYPIYDWTHEDVWLAPAALGWDYNRAYETMEKAGIPLAGQRCAPPFGEQPIRRLDTYKECWPALWAKMVDRVPGAATAARYANTELYGYGLGDGDKPADMTWEKYTLALMADLDPESKADVAWGIDSCLVTHASRTTEPVPDSEPHRLSGFCWKDICVIARVGGNKLKRQEQKVLHRALENRKRFGITS